MDYRIILKNMVMASGQCIPDKIFLDFRYWLLFHRRINWRNPQRFTEKIQWLKIYNRNPQYTVMADKYLAKEYVAEKIGSQYIIPTIKVWENENEIDFDTLPDQFVLKCTHDSGGVFICTDKKNLDFDDVKKKIGKRLKNRYYLLGREWAYKDIKPRIIAEEYVVDENTKDLKDYKIFCFNGIPKLIQVDFDRFKNHKRNIYTTEWKKVDAEIQYQSDLSIDIPKPKCLDEMLDLASILSKGIPHLRTDFYVVNGKIYFGELTLYHGSGLERFKPDSLDYTMGSWIKLEV